MLRSGRCLTASSQYPTTTLLSSLLPATRGIVLNTRTQPFDHSLMQHWVQVTRINSMLLIQAMAASPTLTELTLYFQNQPVSSACAASDWKRDSMGSVRMSGRASSSRLGPRAAVLALCTSHHHIACKKGKKVKEKFTLFSDHDWSLVRRQPRATLHAMEV